MVHKRVRGWASGRTLPSFYFQSGYFWKRGRFCSTHRVDGCEKRSFENDYSPVPDPIYITCEHLANSDSTINAHASINWSKVVTFPVILRFLPSGNAKVTKMSGHDCFFFFTLKTKKKSSRFQTKLDTFGQPLKTYDRFLTLLATQTWTKRGTTTTTTTAGKQWWVSWYRLKKYCCFTKTLRKGSLGYTWFNAINHGITSHS